MRFDFPTIMVLLVAVSGAIWAFDALLLAPRRRVAVARTGEVGSGSGEAEIQPPKVVEYARSFFPVFLIVLGLRSFLVEPFRIPSGSMMPTLLIGDFILVNKFTYGIRLPITDQKIIKIGNPERGDVVVFRYPQDPSTPFIKRIVGLPGDKVAYFDKVLYVNGEPMAQTSTGRYVGTGSGVSETGADVRVEQFGTMEHTILVKPSLPSMEGEMEIPPGHYFVLGDNRDNSKDSRYWGTVPDTNLIGKAFTIWMNWDWGHGIDWGRIGTSIR